MLPCFQLIINFLRAAIPSIALLGSCPIFIALWFVLRLITLICCSDKTYRRYDDYLYSLYQRFVLFFFENWVNVKVCFNQSFFFS